MIVCAVIAAAGLVAAMPWKGDLRGDPWLSLLRLSGFMVFMVAMLGVLAYGYLG